MKITNDFSLVTNRNLWKSTAILHSYNDQYIIQDCFSCKWLKSVGTKSCKREFTGRIVHSPGELWSFGPMSCQGKSRTARSPQGSSLLAWMVSLHLLFTVICVQTSVSCFGTWVPPPGLNMAFPAPMSHLPWEGRWNLLAKETYSLGPKFPDRGKDTGYPCQVGDAHLLSSQLDSGVY